MDHDRFLTRRIQRRHSFATSLLPLVAGLLLCRAVGAVERTQRKVAMMRRQSTKTKPQHSFEIGSLGIGDEERHKADGQRETVAKLANTTGIVASRMSVDFSAMGPVAVSKTGSENATAASTQDSGQPSQAEVSSAKLVGHEGSSGSQVITEMAVPLDLQLQHKSAHSAKMQTDDSKGRLPARMDMVSSIDKEPNPARSNKTAARTSLQSKDKGFGHIGSIRTNTSKRNTTSSLVSAMPVQTIRQQKDDERSDAAAIVTASSDAQDRQPQQHEQQGIPNLSRMSARSEGEHATPKAGNRPMRQAPPKPTSATANSGQLPLERIASPKQRHQHALSPGLLSFDLRKGQQRIAQEASEDLKAGTPHGKLGTMSLTEQIAAQTPAPVVAAAAPVPVVAAAAPVVPAAPTAAAPTAPTAAPAAPTAAAPTLAAAAPAPAPAEAVKSSGWIWSLGILLIIIVAIGYIVVRKKPPAPTMAGVMAIQRKSVRGAVSGQSDMEGTPQSSEHSGTKQDGRRFSSYSGSYRDRRSKTPTRASRATGGGTGESETRGRAPSITRSSEGSSRPSTVARAPSIKSSYRARRENYYGSTANLDAAAQNDDEGGSF